MKLAAFTWVPVAQPLYVARTGMSRSSLGKRPDKTVDEWIGTLDDAESGLADFCQAVRVYALGIDPDGTTEHGQMGSSTAYLAAGYAMYDDGSSDSEVYVTADTPEEAERNAREWVTGWRDRAKARLAQLGVKL